MSINEFNVHKKLQDTETFISHALRLGVTISAVIVGLGFLMLIITGSSGYPGSTYPTSPIQIIKGAVLLKPYAVILAGLLILILTPVFRVCISIFAFFKEKDYLYVVITSFVFIVLMISFLLGKVE